GHASQSARLTSTAPTYVKHRTHPLHLKKIPPPAPSPPRPQVAPTRKMPSAPPPPPNPVLEATNAQWLYTEAELLRTPSILDGMSPETEFNNRHKGVNFIIQ